MSVCEPSLCYCRPSLQQLMTCGDLSEPPPPPPPVSSADARSDSSLLRVLVNGRRRVAPYWRMEQMPFVDMVLQVGAGRRLVSVRPSDANRGACDAAYPLCPLLHTVYIHTDSQYLHN